MATHTKTQLERALDAFAKVKKKCDVVYQLEKVNDKSG